MKSEKGFSVVELLIVVAIVGILAAIVIPIITERSTDSSVVSRNISKAADMFEIERRVVFYNGITGGYLLSIEGLCSIEDQAKQLEVTCRTGEESFKKHFLGLSDNVTYFAEQLDGVNVSKYHYRVIFKPEVIIPDIDISTSLTD